QRMANLYERSGKYSEGLASLLKTRQRYADEDMPFPPALKQIDLRLRERLTLPRDNELVHWPGRRMVQLPFFGRKPEMERLLSAYHRGGVTLLLGEAGSGKTRLVQELFRRLEPPPRLLVALARPLETDLPFQPLIDMLRSQVTADEWRKLPGTWLAAISLLLPELKTVFPELGDFQAVDALAQPVLFEALYQALTLLSRGSRLLFFVDAVQWCDETTLNALTYLYEHDFFGDRAALVLACRDEEQSTSLQHILKFLSHRAALEQIHLSPLAQEDVAAIARFVLGAEISDQVVERFGRDTGGNPLFLLESLRALLEYPPEVRKTIETGRLPVSTNMHVLIHQRLEKLSADAGLALTIAAVIGSQTSLDVLEQACNIGPDRLVTSLEELEQRHLLHAIESGDAGSIYHFNHDRIREIIHTGLSPARRRIYHLRVANALKNKHGTAADANGAVLAYHYENAGEMLAAFTYWVKAADYARRLYSLVEADTAYHNAQRLLDQLDTRVSDEEVFYFYNGWIDFAFNTGNADCLSDAAQRMLSVGYRRQSQKLVGRAHLGLSGVADLRDQPLEGLQSLEEARPYLEQSGSPVLWLRFHNRRGGFLILLNRYVEAIQELEEAMSQVEDPSDAAQIEALGNVRYRLAQAYLQNGWPARSLKQGELLLEESRALFNHAGGLHAITTIAIAEHFMGRYAASIEHARTALRMVAPMKNPWLAGTIHVSLAKAELGAGHLDEAWEQAGLALEIASSLRAPRISAQAYRVRGDVMGALGNLKESENYSRMGIEAADPNYSMVDNQFRLGWILVLQGRVAEGDALIDEVLRFCVEN
nr:AAA family ATPase [Anaerolinea sp.]